MNETKLEDNFFSENGAWYSMLILLTLKMPVKVVANYILKYDN